MPPSKPGPESARFGLSSETIETICAVFREFSDIREVVIFGSRAMGNFKPGSDVDLALKGGISDVVLSRIRSRLNEELPLPYIFDVVDESTVSRQPLRAHIAEFGKIFYTKQATSQ